MNDKIISVIVPVYNTQKYLKRCIDSIKNQTYSNLQILLIDDGSTDESPQICDEYKKIDNRIKVIHKVNSGPGDSRNIGIDESEGELISFVDSDDWIPLNLYEESIKYFNTLDVDVVQYDRELVKQYKNINIKENADVKVLENNQILEDYLYVGARESQYSMCNKIFKKSLFDNVRFPEDVKHEDIITLYNVLSNAKKLAKSNEIGYYYFQNQTSRTNGKLVKKDFDIYKVGDELYELALKTNNKKIIKYAKIKQARSDFSLLAKIAYYGIDDELNKKKIIKDLTKSLRKNYKILIMSNIKLSRKVLVNLFCINYNIAQFTINIFSKI